MSSPRPPLVVITGPTASGKSRTALAVAHAFQERGIPSGIISADSVQVYRRMDIGSDKLSPEQREGVPHYLIDVVDPDETFSAAAFAREADQVIARMAQDSGAAIVAGGTGFYVRALLYGLFPGPAADMRVRRRLKETAEREGLAALYQRLREADPESSRRIHPHDPVRIIRALEVYELTGEPMSAHFSRHRREARYPVLLLGLAVERREMYERINARVLQMFERGLVEEVKRLRADGYGPELKSQQALGYKQIHRMLDGKLEGAAVVPLIQRDTRHYARRQLTWLRAEADLVWIPGGEREKIVRRCLEFFEGRT